MDVLYIYYLTNTFKWQDYVSTKTTFPNKQIHLNGGVLYC